MTAADDMANGEPRNRAAAILLVGPTGSGKTPLGNLLEAKGLWGKRCVHFDFGSCLRACAAGEGRWAALTRAECGLVARLLDAGALLEDEQFPIAEKVLRAFLAGCGAGPHTRVILNGLPRHVGQAADIERIVRIEAVVYLACLTEVVCRRIGTNAGGDRHGRTDDHAHAVRRRLATFQQRTAPLLAHYRGCGRGVITLDVGLDTTAEAMWQQLEALPPPGAR